MVIKKHLAHDDKQNKNKKRFHKLKKTEKKVDDLTHPSHTFTNKNIHNSHNCSCTFGITSCKI